MCATRKLAWTRIVVAAVALGVGVGLAGAEEVTVKNDSLGDGGTGVIQAGFVAGESAAVWLTSPCEGTVVAVQVFWRSQTGTAPMSFEDSITIYAEGSQPVPGAVLQQIVAPVMTDGALNEFRYLDEDQLIPVAVSVSSGQVFAVSFKFANTTPPGAGPSVVTDVDGCQWGLNAIDEATLGWTDSCFFGVSGDFVIRAVIECGAVPGACCTVGGGCDDTMIEPVCLAGGGDYHGDGVPCTSVTCEEACCFDPE